MMFSPARRSHCRENIMLKTQTLLPNLRRNILFKGRSWDSRNFIHTDAGFWQSTLKQICESKAFGDHSAHARAQNVWTSGVHTSTKQHGVTTEVPHEVPMRLHSVSEQSEQGQCKCFCAVFAPSLQRQAQQHLLMSGSAQKKASSSAAALNIWTQLHPSWQPLGRQT